MSITKDQAAELWDGLKTNLLAVEDSIKQIIATKAWEPLGYETFAECWADRLSGVQLVKELRAVVIFQMFEEKATPADAARAVKGAGVVEVTSLHSAWNAGMDAKDAAFVTRSHRRTKPTAGAPRTVSTTLQAGEYEALRAMAAAADVSLSEYVRACVVESLTSQVMAA